MNERTRELISANTSLSEEIAERKFTERLLRESEERLKAILDHSPSLIFIKDLHGRYLHINSQFERVFHLSSEEVLGKTDEELFPPRQAAQFRENDQQVIQAKAPLEFEEVALHEDGPHTSVVSKFPLFDIKGELCGICGITLDITERTQAERLLKESQARFQTIFDSAAIGIALVDMEGRPVESNPALQEFLGYGGDELRTMVFTEFTHPDDAVTDMDLYKELVAGKRNFYQMEKRYIQKDGSMVWAQLHVSLVRDAKGNREYAIGMVSDITERKRAEEEHLRLLATLENATDFVGMADQNGRLLYINKAGRKMVGRTPEEDLRGTGIPEFHPDWANTQILNEGLPAATRDGFWVGESALLHRSGREIPVSLVVVAHQTREGKLERFSAIMRDLTERKRLEEESLRLNVCLEERVRQRTAELETKNAELERFTYTVSHDLKAPLVTIQGFLNLIQEDIRMGKGHQLENDLKRIEGATMRMQQLLNEVLELSRVGRVVNPPEEVAMGKVVQEAVEGMMGLITRGGVQVDIAPNLPVVFGDRPRLVEVIQNLVDNGVKFMGRQRAPRIEIGERQIKGEHVLYVADNGIGIESQYREKVFGLFERLDTQTGGTGIGLSLAKRIIELHGGRIWVESAGLDQGSTFCLTLPAAKRGESVFNGMWQQESHG